MAMPSRLFTPREFCRHGGVPSADEYRGHGTDLGIEPGGNAPFDAAQIRLGGGPYCSRENSSVTLTGTPAKIASSMAGKPSLVPGILMKRLGRPARVESFLAAAMVLAVSCASNGDTSSDTQPSTPFVRS